MERGAEAGAHGCAGNGNDQYRMEVAFKYYSPDEVIASVGELSLIRAQGEEVLRKHGIDPEKRVGKIGGGINIWLHSIGSGQLEGLSTQVASDYLWAASIEEADENGVEVVEFAEGVPTAVDGITDPVSMLTYLNEVGGRNGVGRVDILEDGIMGLKSRGIYEAPAAEKLLKLHANLEHLVLTKEQLKSEVDRLWADMVYHGMWLHPLKRDLDAFMDSTQRCVNGKCKVRLFKGNVLILQRDSKDILFAPELRFIFAD